MNGQIYNRYPIYGYALKFLKFNKIFSKSLLITLFISLLSLSTLIGYIRCVNESKKEMNQKIYGEWQAAFFDIDEKDKKILESNPFINNEGIMKVYGDIQDKNNNEIGSIGTINSELFKIGRLDLLEGKLPENSDEIVMETSTLSSLGYPYLLNQVVELPIKEYQNPNEILLKKYKLTGILRSYSMNWYHDDKLVSAIVSDYSATINQDYVNKMHIFIIVQEGYEEALNNISLKSSNTITNKYLMINDSQKYIMELIIILSIIVSVSMIYLIFSFYRNKLKKSLNILCDLGSTKFQMIGFLFGLIFYKFICASMFAFIFSILIHIYISDYFSLPIQFVLDQSYMIFNVTVVLIVSIVTILGSLLLVIGSVIQYFIY